MKKIIGLALILILVFSSISFATTSAFWPEGWSDVEQIGSYSRTLGQVQWVQIDDTMHFLSTKDKDDELVFQLKSYSLVDAKVVGEIDLFSTSRGIQDVKLYIDDEYISVIWVDLDNNLNQFVYDIISEKGETKHIYRGHRNIYTPFVTRIGDSWHFFWSQVFEGSTNILHGSVDSNGNFTRDENVFLGNDVLNRVEDIKMHDGLLYISWVGDGSQRGLAGLVNVFLSIFDGTQITQTEHIVQFTGESSGKPRLTLINDELQIFYEYVSASTLSGQKFFNISIVGIGDDSEQTISIPSNTGFSIEGDDSDILKLVTTRFVGNNTELFYYKYNNKTQLQEQTRLTYSSKTYSNPILVSYDGYEFIFYDEGMVRNKSLLVINNKFEGTPTVWRELGVDEENVLASLIYNLTSNLMMAALFSFYGTIFAAGIWAVFALLRKFKVLSGASENWKSNLLQSIVACLAMTYTMDSFLVGYNHQMFTPFQVYASIAAIALIIVPISLSKLRYEDVSLPLAILGYTMIYIMMFMHISIISFV
ncbi:hypothetical protein HYG86_13275 [Alkalicella caledoniensis]|uniref:Uncharacterized protein n=1 Tax=Alkalicella caledoniensis TaxID=2731377 RepID=A0A7G9WAG7_ALKCA|nr:hypothetical protein [Alkalicella caledoniensis]QNO15679.1 hypothetical protein HYG86_13275 [Alkalicella caledoniensis]